MILFVVKIEGESMWPRLTPGRRYFATSLLRPRVGSCVVFKNPNNPSEYFVKQVKSIQADEYAVGGMVPWSSEYRVLQSQVLGRLIHHRT